MEFIKYSDGSGYDGDAQRLIDANSEYSDYDGGAHFVHGYESVVSDTAANWNDVDGNYGINESYLKQLDEIDQQIPPDESKLRTSRSRCPYLKEYLRQEGTKVAFVGLWAIITLALFLERFIYYAVSNNQRAAAVFEVFSYGVCFARAAANALKFNCVLLIILACRWITSYLLSVKWARAVIPLEKIVGFIFHKYVALACLILTGIHVIGHLANSINISKATVPQLQKFWGQEPIPQAQVSTADFFMSRPGITGMIATVALIYICTTSLRKVRRQNFEFFFYSHHIAMAVFYACLLAHSSNILEPPVFWIWFLPAAVLYIIDRMVLRWTHTYHHVKVISSKMRPGEVICLELEKPPKFNYHAGQYLRLCVPSISRLQYHPFTITSAHEDKHMLQLHIFNNGNWTREVGQALPMADVSIQGPYGSSAWGIWDYKAVMLVGGGIGVTPFASVLKTIANRLKGRVMDSAFGDFQGGGSVMKVQHVHFVWMHKVGAAFTWFEELMTQLKSYDLDRFLKISIYLTKKGNVKQAGIQELVHKVGRPCWSDLLDELKETAGYGKAGVFVCGPKGLSKDVYNECQYYENVVFHREYF